MQARQPSRRRHGASVEKTGCGSSKNGLHKPVNLRRFRRNAILVCVLRLEKGDMHHEKIPDI